MTSPHPHTQLGTAWRLLVARPLRSTVLCAVAVATAAGCTSTSTSGHSHGSQPSATSTATAAASGGSGNAGPASQVLTAVAAKARQIASVSATMDVTTTGTQAGTVHGTMASQANPFLSQMTFRSSTGGAAGNVTIVATSTAVYLKVSGLSTITKKPWVKLSVSSLNSPTGATLAPIVRDFQADNPATQAQMLTAATNVHQVGTATINGIPTTEYSGSLNLAAAIAKDPNLRRELGSALASGVTGTVKFNVWVDSQDIIRKIVDTTTEMGNHSTVTILITSVNKPVSVTIPPASQVGTLPGF
ncbi:MAG TPA: hypothetical protein VGS19_34700 [Streptosporangiaceae bacterium]|nr:hypothetical protein [Streptosporangiaceae bacterium]